MAAAKHVRAHPKHWALRFAAITFLGFAWWILLAPNQLGGPVTLAVVEGSSMQPLYQSGDLVVAYRESTYGVGDNIIYERFGGFVIHKIVTVNADKSFATKGINNKYPDTWKVPPANILGKQAIVLPGAGAVIQNVLTNPITAGTFSLLVAALVMLPTRRSRLYGDAKQLATHESTEKIRFRGRRTFLFWLLAAIFVVLLGIFSFFIMSNVMFWPRIGISLIGLTVFGALLFAYSLYLFDGVGLQEPVRSLVVLGPTLLKISESQKLIHPIVVVSSAKNLRKVKEKLKTIVIHQVDASGHHNFYVSGHGENYLYKVANKADI